MTLRVFAAPTGLVVNAPVKPTCHAVRAWSTVLFDPVSRRVEGVDEVRHDLLPARARRDVVTLTDGCWPLTVTAFVAVEVATIAYAWFAVKVRGKMQV